MSALGQFLVPALIVSGGTLTALALAPAMPPRLKLAVAAVGLAAWVLPWPWVSLPALMPAAAPLFDWLGDGALRLAPAAPALNLSSPVAAPTPGPVISLGWLALLLPGLVWFAFDCASHARCVRDWRLASRSGSALARLLPDRLARLAVRVRVVPGATIAATTGLIRPTVWIGDRLLTDTALRAVLAHEYWHVRARDPLWLALILFVQRLWWWNPLVGRLADHARLAIETKCDEHCARLLGDQEYLETLARLMLNAQPRPAALLTPMLRTRSSNLKRIAALRHGSSMGARGWTSIAVATGSGIFAVAVAATEPPDPRIGSWFELTASSHAAPMWRRFEDLGGGMTRVAGHIAPDGTTQNWTDHRCDGRMWPAASVTGESPHTFRCRRLDRYTMEYSTAYTDGSGQAAHGLEQVSRDGRTYTVTVTRTDADGQIIESAQREFWRLQ